MSFFADRSATDHKVRPVSRLTMTFMLLPVVVAGSFSRLLHTSLLHSALCDELMNVLDIRTQVTTNQYGHPKRRGMAWYSGRLEGIVGGSGTAVGTSISLADVMIYNTFAESLDEAESPQSECSTHSLALSLSSHLGPKQQSATMTRSHTRAVPEACRYAFGDKSKSAETLAAHPNLAAICAAVKAQPGMVHWLATRGAQGF